MISQFTALVFTAGVCYGIAGTGLARRLSHDLDKQCREKYGIHPGSFTRMYVDLMTVLLWPIPAAFILVGMGYDQARVMLE